MVVQKIRKVVFPVGGLGTRFLPATKAMPKEMLPVVDKPLIQYAFEEAVDAGIEQFIFVIGRNKTAIHNHFDRAYELERTLNDKEKTHMLDQASGWLPEAGNIAFIRQLQPLGLGHAVWCARHFINDEPFAVVLADVLLSKPGLLKEMVKSYEKNGGNIIALNDVPRERTKDYGIAALDGKKGNLFNITGMVEKPAPSKAPSTHAILGRYILSADIFPQLEKTKQGAGGEIQLTDAMQALMKKQPFYGLPYTGEVFDCGSKEGFLEATVAFSLARADLKGCMKKIIQKYQ